MLAADCGGVVAARETPVTVREVDLRELLVHVISEVELITCVWSRIGQAARHSTPVSRSTGLIQLLSNEVDDAEGRDREQAGDAATGGKRKGHSTRTSQTR